MAGKPLNTPLFTSKDPKYHLIELRTFRGLHKKSFQKAAFFLQNHGFEPFVTLEDQSMVQGMFQDIWINKLQKIYATIHINKASGKVIYTMFAAFTSGKTYLAVDNTYAISIRYPKNIIIHHSARASLDTIFHQLLDLLGQRHDTPRFLSLPSLLFIGTKIRRYSIEQGIKQKLLYTKWKGNLGATACYNHPVSVAVRICSVCQMHLCEACYESYQDRYYCKNCLPQTSQDARQPILPADGLPAGFAGIGIRTIAWLLDGVGLAATTVAVYMGLTYAIGPRIPDASLPFILTQFFLMMALPFYFIFTVKHSGQTLGMKMLGLRVVDQQGRIPDGVAALVRFAYFLFSCLFVFPLIGYLFVIFRKTKQGLHDQLASTLVVTNHPVKKAIFAWSMLLIVLAISGGYAVKWVKPWMNLFRSIAPQAIASEVSLETSWVLPFEDRHQFLYSFVVRGETVILSSSTAAQALNLRSGKIIWANDDLAGATIQVLSAHDSRPLLMLQFNEGEFPHLRNVDPESGAILWQRLLELRDPVLIYDARTILVYDINRLYAYTTGNQLLWQKSFSDNFRIGFASLNQNILIARYSETSRRLTYLSRKSGNILWEIPDSPYEPGYTLGQGYQCLYTHDGKSNLMYLPQKRWVWKSPQRIGYVAAHLKAAASDLTTMAPALFTTTSAVRRQDGTIVFSYPAGARFGCLSDDFLMLIQDDPAKNPAGSKAALLVVDKHTGITQRIFPGQSWLSVKYAGEDKTHIYLVANHNPEKHNPFNVVSKLLILDKRTFELQEIPVGKNIASHQIQIFPGDDLIFIPTYQQVGAYVIPAQAAKVANQ